MQKLTLVSGLPTPGDDVPPTGTFFDSDYGVTGPSFNLSMLSDLTLFDIFSDGSALYATPMPEMEVLLTGTPIGGMTANGGLASAFDGNLAKGYAACARSGSKVAGYTPPNSLGLSLGSASIVTRFVASSPVNNAFSGDDEGMFVEYRVSNINDITTGVILFSGYAPPMNPIAGAVSEIRGRFPNGVPCLYAWIIFYGSGNNVFVCQLRSYAQLPFSARGLISVTGTLMNSNAIPAAIGNSGPVALPAQSVAYRGTILTNVGGLMHSTLSNGRDRIQPIYNINDRRKTSIIAGNPDAANGTFSYTPSPYAVLDANDWPTYYALNSDPSICVTVVSGLDEGTIDAQLSVGSFQNGTVGPTAYTCAIDVKKFNDPSPYFYPMGQIGQQNFDSSGIAQGSDKMASVSLPSGLGALKFTAIETRRGNVSASFGEPNTRFVVQADI